MFPNSAAKVLRVCAVFLHKVFLSIKSCELNKKVGTFKIPTHLYVFLIILKTT